ncbi:MAG: hypothetical protein ACFFBS_04695 [Promethearchaeota archaeon]
MDEISKLTEKYSEVRSSDNKKLGVVREILGNEILATVSSHYVGRSGSFILPRNMIDKIKGKKVYLTLNEKEFEAWWDKEGPLLEAEYLEREKERIRLAFEANFGVEEASYFLKHNRCPYCGSFITGKEQLRCYYCGLYLIKDDSGDYRVPNEQRVELCLEQEKLRMALPVEARELLGPDEWVHYSIIFSSEDGGLLVTSQRLIKFKFRYKKEEKEENWEIPLDKVLSVSVVQCLIHHMGTAVMTKIWAPSMCIDLGIEYEIPKKYIADKGYEVKQLSIPAEKSSIVEIESIKRYVEKLKEIRRIKQGDFVPASDY